MSLFGPKTYPDGQSIINFVEEIIDYQKSFMEVVSKVRSENMMTFPVLSFCLLKKDGKFVDEEFAMWACRHNMKWADSNFFVSDDITSLSNCCRLVSDIKNLGYFNSLSVSALEVGSVKVNTVNLARIAYMQNSKEEYLDILKEKVKLCCKALDSQRYIIKRNIEKGMLPNYSKGIMKLSSQYSTIGIVALYEAIDKFGLCEKDKFGYTKYTEDGLSFAKDILKCITETKNDFQKDKDYSINIEQIPAERAAAVLMEKDKILFPNEKYELPLYGNQWIPLGVKTTLNEKIRVSAELDKACSGGSISHINLDAPIENFDTAWSLLNYISDNGVTYFAFCTRISACENNHGFYGEICPHCGKPKKTTYQRIVGFLTPESSYSKERKAEFKMRDWFEIQKLQEI